MADGQVIRQSMTLAPALNDKISLYKCVCVSYLEQAGVKQQCVRCLGVVLTLQVKVPQLVQVPEHTHTRVQNPHSDRGQAKHASQTSLH